MRLVTPRTRYAAFILLVALCASLAVAFFRWRVEAQSRRVELSMDYSDFLTLARSYAYDPDAFLIALRRAGLTSLAIREQLGSDLQNDGDAYVATGAALLAQARLSPLSDPLLARLVRTGGIDRDAVYLIGSRLSTRDRLLRMLRLHLEPTSVRLLRAAPPWLIEARTEIDYFNQLSLGIPQRALETARRLGLIVDPRFQNDERYDPARIAALFATLDGIPRVSTVIFFGLSNEVLGYPDALAATAQEIAAHRYSFGTIEVYDPSQLQKGNETLGRMLAGRIVRVQAIPALQLDKLRVGDVVSRYVLGVRERNVRVVYLRPYPHREGDLSIEATNVALVSRLADALRADGFTLGRATPIPLYRGNDRVLVGLAALAVPSLFVLLLEWFGWYRRSLAVTGYLATIALYGAGLLLHHDVFARALIALVGALLFAVAAFAVYAPAFTVEPNRRFGGAFSTSLRWTLVATGIALLGALTVVGVLSTPLTMEEIERFRGVKLILALPPLAALASYLFTGRYGVRVRLRDLLREPVRVYQTLLAIVLLGAAALMLMRSGNQSEIAPSHLELLLRHDLTKFLSVRPRFKEFLIGFPCMMLVPALASRHRPFVGWLLALGIGVGIGDVIDTFSHLHTPLAISVVRVSNGLILGVIVAAIAIALYRRFVPDAVSDGAAG